MFHEKSFVFVFDFDGTLCDSYPMIVKIVNKIAPDFGFSAMAAEELSHLRDLSLRECLQRLGIPLYRLPQLAKKVGQELHRCRKHLRPFPGIPETLGLLRENHHQLGILTSNSEKNVRDFLERFDLPPFEFIFSGGHLFGKEKMIRNMLRKRQLKQEDVLYVGDEVRDIEAAHGAGVKMVAVSWGMNSREVLQSCLPEYLIESPKDLIGLWK